jgi:hypothetical protein
VDVKDELVPQSVMPMGAGKEHSAYYVPSYAECPVSKVGRYTRLQVVMRGRRGREGRKERSYEGRDADDFRRRL